MLADLAAPLEAVLLEELDRRAEEEAAMCLAPRGHFGNRLDETPAATGDLIEGTFKTCPGDAQTTMTLVDEDAGDPPIRSRRRVLVVLAFVLTLLAFLLDDPSPRDAGFHSRRSASPRAPRGSRASTVRERKSHA